MNTITFSQIHERVAEHQRAEEARNAPVAVALDAINILRSALNDMSAAERCEIRDELGELTAEMDAIAWSVPMIPARAQSVALWIPSGGCAHTPMCGPIDQCRTLAARETAR